MCKVSGWLDAVLYILPNILLAHLPCKHLIHALFQMLHQFLEPKWLHAMLVGPVIFRRRKDMVHKAEADIFWLVVFVDLVADLAETAHASNVDFEEIHVGEGQRSRE